MKDTLASQLLKLTVLIKTNTSSQVSSYGTGFLLKRNEFIFLVTNKHVIEGSKKIYIKFFGQPDFTLISEQFVSSDDYDISICWLINIPDTVKCISEEFIPSEEDIEKLDAIEDIIFIGYPTGLYDEYNHSPIVRKGITATPLSINYEDKSLFLIDASIFPGSSGSPVFRIFNGNLTINEKGIFEYKIMDVLLLGIIAQAYIQGQKKETCLSPTAPPPPVVYRQMIDLGEVIKTKEIIKLIENYINLHTTCETR
jgi:S1-C subfamily serine protease|nr:MAG TPA: Trypsin-like peptidase domain [Caudoviricetes sp.]